MSRDEHFTGRNRAIVAIARILVETIYMMLSRGMEFDDQIESLTERKQKSMAARAKNPVRNKSLDDTVMLFIQTGIGGRRVNFFHDIYNNHESYTQET